ncbi:bifunctional hydroxymethylpyrimidine kinase/phosphomethylpyrimidine kinase [Micromonospora sp. C51]|uniref:PfkB family carbohydrate kinase n=1 Tax=Micromonospora sp. C51 TaxID=2824879 RepID=UPI001B36FF54|nr:PfkB family carbohydrate kinase [Micromonospora sp. C51]MBQ1051832.1 bifunctional hydroxymethylpyrimidine kinase/phosphomethylpyrimidine kinase [Micromonospora sp. C51]
MDQRPGQGRPPQPPQVAFVGRANIDITVRVPQRPVAGRTMFASAPATTTPGGKSLNQALAARMAGVRSSLVSAAGDDPWGTFLTRALDDAAVDVSFFHLVPSASTGVAIIEVTPDGENYIVLARHPKAELTGEHVRDGLQQLQAPIVVTQLDLQPDAVNAVFRHHHARRLIGNLVPHPRLGPTALTPLDVFVSNEAEAAVILGRHHADPSVAAEGLRKLGPRAAVVTAGAHGAAYSSPDHTALIPTQHVNALDTSGAGDAFLGTLAAQLARQAPLPHAVAEGVAAATTFVQIGGR